MVARWLLGVFPIWHEAEPEELRTVNKTEPGHPFHPPRGDPATVTHQVEWDGNVLRYRVTGTGDGPLPVLNNALGVPLFLPGVYETLWRAQSRAARRVRAAGGGR